MPAMVKKAGATLQTGATSTGITGVHTQTSGRSAAGELTIIRDNTGADLSAYVKDPHEELSFEAILESSVDDKEIGDLITISNKKYLVTKWDVSESNDDVKKVSIGLRSTDLSNTTSGGSPS